jgi:hypothetical protein
MVVKDKMIGKADCDYLCGFLKGKLSTNVKETNLASSLVVYCFCQPSPDPHTKQFSFLDFMLGLDGFKPKEKNVIFPYFGQEVNMVIHDAGAMIASLLTCPV